MNRWKEIITFKGDKYLWTMIIILMIASLFLIYSSTGRLAYNKQDGDTLFYVGKQLCFLIGCFGVLFFMQRFSWRFLYDLAKYLMVGAVILLVMAAFGGDNINGAGRWIKIPILGFSFQPSEYAKIAVVIYVAKLFSDYQEQRWCSDEVIKQLWLPALVIGLIFLDNFSTSVLISIVCLVLFVLGRIRWKWLLRILGGGCGILIFVLILGITVPQVRKFGRVGTIISRLTEHVMPGQQGEDKRDYNMQSDHARMAIVQGGLVGRGPGNSVQRNILPHAYSDFIYAILIEEYGLLFGGIGLFMVYSVILFRTIKIAQKSLKYVRLNPRGQPEVFPALLAIGLGVSVTLQALFHMGVNTTFFPVTGQTLPLVSLGGTSLLFTSAALGIVLNVAYTSSPEYQERNLQRHGLAPSDEDEDIADEWESEELSELGKEQSKE